MVRCERMPIGHKFFVCGKGRRVVLTIVSLLLCAVVWERGCTQQTRRTRVGTSPTAPSVTSSSSTRTNNFRRYWKCEADFRSWEPLYSTGNHCSRDMTMCTRYIAVPTSLSSLPSSEACQLPPTFWAAHPVTHSQASSQTLSGSSYCLRAFKR